MAKAATRKTVAVGKSKALHEEIVVGKGSSLDIVLKNGTTVVIIQANNAGGIGHVVYSGIGKLSGLKEGLTKLFDTVESSTTPVETFNVMLEEVVDSASARQPTGGGLTNAGADFLVRSGAFTSAHLHMLESRVRAGELAHRERETRLGALSRTLSADEVGDLLGISASRVRHRQGSNLLYAFRAGKSRRYPLWQFVPGTDQVIPGLADVIPAFLDDWHAAAIEGFMTTPQADLPAEIDGAAGEAMRLTPIEWLVGGGDPADVVAILDRISRT
jgi:hypothetical protein